MPATERVVFFAWDRTGVARLWATVDDVTGRIDSLRVDNQSDRYFRISIYETKDYSTVVFQRDVPPKTAATQGIPPGQDYFIDDWIASCGFL